MESGFAKTEAARDAFFEIAVSNLCGDLHSLLVGDAVLVLRN